VRGKDPEGAQCKRDAREGSAFCAIHVDQQTRPREERPPAEWTSEDMLKAALGFAVLAAIALFRFRR
jgi:hypothetical protein